MIRRSGKVALLGRPNVGKSTLLNALLGERIAITSTHPQTTRDRIAGILTKDEIQYVFLDTPGFHAPRTRLGERMNELARGAAEEADVAVFVTDVPAGATKATIRDDDRAVVSSIPETTPTLMVLSKIDREKTKERLLPTLDAYRGLREFSAVVPLSARTKDGLDRLLSAIADVLPEGEALFDEDELSDKPLRFFVAEFVREQVLRKTRQEVPHGVAVSVETYDEGPKLVHIAVTIHVAKESHKSILIGARGTMLREIGTEARKRAEILLGRRVHLETWVKASPNWFDDPVRLVDFGYGEGAAKPARRRRTAQTSKKRARTATARRRP